MKKRTQARRFLAAVLAGSLLLSVSAFAYDRQEASTSGGGTEVTVYAGTQNSNSEGNYLEDPGDYMAYNRYETPGYETSESNITSSTNFTATSAGGEVKIVNGGVDGVSWDNSSNTLTLNGACGTVITIEGPEIDPYGVNTYNDKLNPLIGENLQNLTYYKQFDLFTFSGQEAGAPHTKDNATVQDVVYINIEGENSFNNIVITGNVKVVFTGTGTLTLDASQSWDYDDYNDPNFDHLSDPSAEALASYPTVGYQGSLSGMVEEDVMSNARMTETVTEWYEYALPEIVIDGSMYISEGGSVYNTAAVDSDSEYQAWESYVGTEDGPADKVVITAVAFTDVQDSSQYYYEPVYWGYDLGVTAGTSETQFSPNAPCTRAQFVTLLYGLANATGVDTTTDAVNSFTDVTSSDYYYNAVLWAAANGITAGTSATTFTPGRTITRGEAVTMLYSYAGGTASSIENPFEDISAADYAYKAVLWALEQGITAGTTETTFSPNAPCTRAMMITFLYKMEMAAGEDEALVSLIEQAEALAASVTVSEDGRDVFTDTYWAEEAAVNSLCDEASQAEAVLSSSYTAQKIAAAIQSLQAAIDTFDQQKQLGYILAQWDGDFNPDADSNNGIYISEVTGQYFEGDGSDQAVYDAIEALLNAGMVSVNGTVIPAEEPENYEDNLDENGRYVAVDLNGYRGLWYDPNHTGIDIDGDQVIDTVSKWTWQGHDKLMSDKGYKSTKGSAYMLQVPMLGTETLEDYQAGGFEFARAHFVLALSMLRGNTVTLYASATEDGGRSTTAAEIGFDIWSACQVEQMIDNGDGTTTIYGVPVDTTSYNTDGGPNDVESRTFKNENIADDVDVGDTCMYQQDADGEWYLKSCVAVEGLLESSGSNYDIGLVVDGEKTVYCDALVTRYNMQAGSRPSQVLGAINSLDLGSVPVTLWLTESGYVVGISHMEYADEALALALEHVEEYTAAITVSADGSDVTSDADWVTQEAWDTFQAAMESAKSIVNNDAYSNAQKDAATYSVSSAYSTLLNSVQKGTGILVSSFAVNMNGEGALINDEMYDELYAEGSAAEGILAVIEAGNFIINGYAMPGTEEDYLANWADTGYQVNTSAWVSQNEDGTWTTSSRKAAGPYDTVAEACLAILTAKDQLNGQDICLYDTDGDGYVDTIELSYVSAIIVNGITDNGNGTYSVDSGYIAQGTVGTEKPYDGSAFSADSDRVIKAENFDDSIELGDVAIFYYGTDGWVLTRALEITGVLTEAVDHDHYTVNGTEYGDAMMFSRDNLVISNRNGEYANAYMYFGMDALEMEVSLWLVPTTNYPTSTGAPIGITSADASASLTEALKQAQAKLDSVVVSDETGASALEEGTQWVTQETYDQLKAAIDRASEALESESRADLLDYQVYLLYLTLHGSADDIGASFAGYTYDGFDNLIYTAASAEETA